MMAATDKMLQVLSLFSTERSQLLVEQVAAELEASTSTTYRYFRSLSKAGLLESLPGGRYILGPAAVQLDWLIRNTDPLIGAAGPAMRILAGAINVPAVILLCRLYRGQIMCVAQTAAGTPPFASGYQRGRPMPLLRGAASKIILANMPRSMVKAMYPAHAAEMADVGLGKDWQEVRTSLKLMQIEGVSITTGEIDQGLTGIAAAIQGPATAPAGCIAFVLANGDLKSGSTAGFASLIRSAADQIGESLKLL